MRITYSVLYIILIFAMLGCTLIAKRSTRPFRNSVAWLESSVTLPILGNLMIILSDNRTVSFLGHYIYFIGIDIVLFALVNFTNQYCAGTGDGTQKPTVMYVMLGADMVQMMLNPLLGHAFDIKKAPNDTGAYYTLVIRAGQIVHRTVDYVILACVVLIIFLVSIQTPKIYRERFTVILGALIAVCLMQTYYVFTESSYDRPVIGYAFFGMVIFYFAVIYRPLRLLDQMLSNIISDLSDAFYVFDPNGKCIWANEQGCKLVGFTGKNYEDINSGLIKLFGKPNDNDNHIGKKTVGEGDDVRFYLLDEKQVTGSSGKRNGSYLRIQDVTDEEREIKALDEQIENGLTDFAVVMVDMNNLKRINDEYGHKAGDLYIKGCCYLICEAFKHSPVFRIGGDEFVAILRGQDFERRFQNLQDLRDSFDDAMENAEEDPWLRYSASVGMAEHGSDDNSFELVFKRADRAMYEEKKLFKALHGSYR